MIFPAHFLLSLSIILTVWCQTTVLLAAPPANDNLTNAPILHFSGTAAEPSTTVEATMEGGEPFPGGYSAANYQGTTWWSWTPMTGMGAQWYEIQTTGSAVDTVMSIWTGSNFASPLTLLHVNDDNIAIPGEGTNSRIRFLAAQNVTYRIAVASSTAARGGVMLKGLAVRFDNYFRVTAATFSANTVNVATATTVTADVTMPGTFTDFQSGVMTLYTPTNSVLTTTNLTPANRISGSVTNGVYRMTLNIPQGSPVGSCRWGIRVANTTSSIYSSYGWEGMTPLPAGVPTAITVINDPYAAWLTENSMTGPDSVRDADFDKDEIKNLVEYASGSNPRAASRQIMSRSGNTITSVGLPLIATVGTGDQVRLRVEFARRLNDSSLIYTAQFSDDLVNWVDATNAPTVLSTNTNLGYEAVGVEDTVIIPARSRRFGRVKVTQ